jgi:hypothetical protein
MSSAVVEAPVRARPATSWIPPCIDHPAGSEIEAVAEAAAEEALATADETTELADETEGPIIMVRQSGPPHFEPSDAPGQGMVH